MLQIIRKIGWARWLIELFSGQKVKEINKEVPLRADRAEYLPCGCKIEWVRPWHRCNEKVLLKLSQQMSLITPYTYVISANCPNLDNFEKKQGISEVLRMSDFIVFQTDKGEKKTAK
jgi:hypothetical protein